MASFLVSERAGAILQLALADGGSVQVAPAPGGNANAGFLIVPTIAALTAVGATGLLDGQPAAVESNGSLWSLTTSSVAVDGITVASSGTAGRVWQRWGSYITAQAQAQTAWFIDPAAGNDESSGATLGSPLKTKAELFRRWGYTWSPELVGINVVITYLSADLPGTSDEGFFSPYFSHGATLLHTAPLPAPSFTGTLLAVTPKSRAANQALQTTFTTTSGAMALRLLLVNATRGNSRAFAQRNTAGATWQLSQPMAPYPPGTTGLPANTEVDTWANGDAITGYALVPISLGRQAGIAAALQPGVAGYTHVVYNLNVLDPAGLGAFTEYEVDGNSFPLCVECVIDRIANNQNVSVLRGQFSNCALAGLLSATGATNVGGGIGSGGPSVSGGILGYAYTNEGRAILLKGDVIVGTSLFGADIAMATGVFWDTVGIQAVLRGNTENGAAVNYGTGGLNQVQGTYQFTGLAATAFPTTGGLFVNGVGTAYGRLTAAGATTLFNRALSAAALDAASGLATGFGGYAEGGGSVFSKAGVQP